MPFAIRPSRRFLNPQMVYFSAFWSLTALILLSRIPAYPERVSVGSNDQAGMAGHCVGKGKHMPITQIRGGQIAREFPSRVLSD